jgi:hypothetical protein
VALAVAALDFTKAIALLDALTSQPIRSEEIAQ